MEIVGQWADAQPGQLVPDRKLSGTIGLAVFLCKAMRKGRALCHSGFACMAARAEHNKPVSRQLLIDLAAITATVRVNIGVPFLVDPRWWHAGLLGIAGDASVSDTAGGYGGNVQETRSTASGRIPSAVCPTSRRSSCARRPARRRRWRTPAWPASGRHALRQRADGRYQARVDEAHDGGGETRGRCGLRGVRD